LFENEQSAIKVFRPRLFTEDWNGGQIQRYFITLKSFLILVNKGMNGILIHGINTIGPLHLVRDMIVFKKCAGFYGILN
jgi:hypothetical protein